MTLRCRPTVDAEDAFLDTFIPDSANQPYDMHSVILEHPPRRGPFLEVHALFAPNIVVGFGRIEGRPGRRRRQSAVALRGLPRHRCIRKAARFVRTCDAFNIPVITLVDVPGFLLRHPER